MNGAGRGRLGLHLTGLAALILLVFAVACDREAKELGVRLAVDKRRLSNGLTVILVPDATVPVISYQTWFRSGSVDERPGLTGIAHLFEHLMFKGTEKFGPKQFFEQLETRGAEVNAFTTRDYTVYYENFVPVLLPKVVEMEADRMRNLRLSDELLDTERAVVLEERRLRVDSVPEGRMQEAIWALAYRYHPYRWPVIGVPQDVLSVSTEDLREFYRTHYQPANAVVVVTGAFDPDATFELLKKHYGAIPGLPRPKREIPAEPAQNEERRLVLRDFVASERFIQAYRVTAAKDEDSYALDVLAGILFEGTSSRAYHQLVEEKEVAIEISGAAFTPTYPGLFLVSGNMRKGVPVAAAEKLLDQLIREVQEQGVTDEEIRRAVKQLTVDLVDSVRTPHGLGMMVGTVETIFGDPERFTRDLAKYTRVSAADVKRVANQYLIPNNRSIVTMTPEEPEKATARGPRPGKQGRSG